MNNCPDVTHIKSYDWVGYILEDIKNSAKHIKEKIDEGHKRGYIKGSTYLLGVSNIHIVSQSCFMSYLFFTLVAHTSTQEQEGPRTSAG
jgi:hypothetical protein